MVHMIQMGESSTPLSQHGFRSLRRHAAIQRRDRQLFEVQQSKLHVSWELARERARATASEQSLMREVEKRQRENAQLKSDIERAPTQQPVAIEKVVEKYVEKIVEVPVEVIVEKKIGGRFLQSAAAHIIQHRWRLTRKLGDLKCEIVGAPSSLDSERIYTDEQISSICNALVEPLATRIHSLDNWDDVIVGYVNGASLTPVNCKHTLGKLLRDSCSKVVPLTSFLQQKRKRMKESLDQQKREGVRESGKAHQTLTNSTSSSTDTTEELHDFAVSCKANLHVSGQYQATE